MHMLRRCVLAVLILTCIGCGPPGGKKKVAIATGPRDHSVTPEMLIGAELQSRTGRNSYHDLTWKFDATRFRIVAGKDGFPKDIEKALLPPGTSPTRVEGSWTVQGETLTVKDLVVDGKAIQQPPKTLRTICTPVIRIQPQSHQYKFERDLTQPVSAREPLPAWPDGTTRARGDVAFERADSGWLSVGYYGYNLEGEHLSGDATLRIYPHTKRGAAIAPTDSARHTRLRIRRNGLATAEHFGLPPGRYLFYAMWRQSEPLSPGKIAVTAERFRLDGAFATQWILADDRPVAHVDFDIANVKGGDIDVTVATTAESDTASVEAFLLPWSADDAGLKPLDKEQAWRLAFALGCQRQLVNGQCHFENLQSGAYQVFLATRTDPANDAELANFEHYHVQEVQTVHARPLDVTQVTFQSGTGGNRSP